MRGQYGMMIIALGIFVAIMGGYLLNAETVTTCATEWEYVTDVTGAFHGSADDMDVEYDPPANVTGWRYIDEGADDGSRPYNGGWISGVDYSTTRANVYGAYSGATATNALGMTVSAVDYSGMSTEPRCTVTVGGGEAAQHGMAAGFGLCNREVLTAYRSDGAERLGAFGVRLSDILDGVPFLADYWRIELGAAGSVSGYPAFARASVSSDVGQVTFPDGTTGRAVVAAATASAAAASITVMPQESAAIIAGVRCPVSEVILAWGAAQFNGHGSHSDTVRIEALCTALPERVFVDPAKGVVTGSGTYTTADVAYRDHDGSSVSSAEVRASHVAWKSESSASGSIVAEGGGLSLTVLTWAYMFGSNGAWILTYSHPSEDEGSRTVTGSGEAPALTLKLENGVLTVSAAGESSYFRGPAVPDPVSAYRVGIDRQSGWEADASVTLIRGDGSGETVERAGETVVSMAYRTAEETATTHRYSRQYWCNGYDNAAATFVFAPLDGEAPAGGRIASISTVTEEGGRAWRVACVGGAWSIGSGAASADVGAWPAIEVTLTSAGIYARPITAFTSFTDYNVIDMRTEAVSHPGSDATIQYLDFGGRSGMSTMCVRTVTRIAGGGLYLQDAELDLAAAFPEARAVSLTIGSAAREGGSITVGGESAVTLAVRDGAVDIGGERVPLAGLTLRWVSASAETVTIGGVAYSPAIYHRGATYAAGTVWAETPGGSMLMVVASAEPFSVRLDGTWAAAVSMYEGHNAASESMRLADIAGGVFKWDKADFVVIVMGVCIIGGIAGTHLRLAKGADWLIIAGAVAILWVVLR